MFFNLFLEPCYCEGYFLISFILYHHQETQRRVRFYLQGTLILMFHALKLYYAKIVKIDPITRVLPIERDLEMFPCLKSNFEVQNMSISKFFKRNI